jgi:hypothetical protein
MLRDLISRLRRRRQEGYQPLRKIILGEGADGELLEQLLEYLPENENLPVLDFATYRSKVAHLPPPTDEQIKDFAAFIAEAKSWYKHLPLFPPGVLFCFFMDPNAGTDRVILGKGRVAFHPRTEGSSKLHYSWLASDTYRARFGYLSYACPVGTRVYTNFPYREEKGQNTWAQGLLDNNPSLPAVQFPLKGLQVLPVEIFEQASALITGVIHPWAATVGCWHSLLRSPVNTLQWPEETGGSDIIDQIKARCVEVQRLKDSGGEVSCGDDPVLTKLLMPERERLLATMTRAMQQLRRLLYVQ